MSYCLKNVELFRAGVIDGEEFTIADLDQAINNFKRFSTGASPELSPTAVVGHEEEQQLLANTGIPAAGWVTDLRRYGDLLVCDVSEVPEIVAQWIKDGSYRKVSAEFYADSGQAGLEPGHGLTFRRFAMLGGELPKVKGLKDLPFAQQAFSESDHSKRLKLSQISKINTGLIKVFSEVSMNREEMVAKALAFGITQTVVDLCDDATLQAMLESIAAKTAPVTAAETPVDPEKKEAPSTTCTEPVLVEPSQAPPVTLVAVPAPVASSSTGAPQQMVLTPAQFSEAVRKEALKVVKQELAKSDSITAKDRRDRLKASVKQYCERWVKEGKILPADADEGSKVTNTYHLLLAASQEDRVFKFGERSLSSFEMIVEDVERRTPVKFSEKIKQPQQAQHGEISPERRAELLGYTLLGRTVAQRN